MTMQTNLSGNEGAPGAAESTAAPLVRIERGTCWMLFAHDIGMSIDLNEAERRITDDKHRETIRRKRPAPQYFEYDPPPLRVTQVVEQFPLGEWQTAASVDLMIFDFGTVSVSYSIPLSGSISGLQGLANTLYDNELLAADARRRVEQLLEAIRPAVNRPCVSEIVEDYAIYQIESCQPPIGTRQAVADFGQLLAQILRAESEPLSEDEVKDALACRISYGRGDLLIVDWNATILFDSESEDVRSVLEFANVEMLEMRFLDNRLDGALDESYETLTRRTWSDATRWGTRARDLRRVAQLQVDSAVLFEGVNNAIKLLGDQYLARVYRAVSQRLHLNEWDASIIRKLQTLESIYEKMTDWQANRRMEVLEWIIIILIAISILLPFVPGLPGY
ncbi:MAG TPA: hypothetical protein VLM89_02940 [Phycisphaerae bacterium]|nr:hypothetical protein [Phycisphaerae bacterium]